MRRTGFIVALALALLPTHDIEAKPSPTPSRPVKSGKSATPSKMKARPASPAKTKFPRRVEKRPRVSADPSWASSPASRYAALDRDGCLKELAHRQISFTSVTAARGVRIPIRLKGPLAGVTFQTELPASERATSPYEVYDCRLVLALEDWAKLLSARGIDEVTTFSSWRPPATSWPADKPATRHPGALAVDIRRLSKKADGVKPKTDLVVLRDWSPARDVDGCASTIAPDTDEARALRAIWCEAVSAKLFNTMLGPNYNAAHENHFHLELTPDVTYRLIL
jgi:hypothetical protein